MKTSILNKDGRPSGQYPTRSRTARQASGSTTSTSQHKKHTWIQDGTNQNSRILRTVEQGHNFGTQFYLQN